MIVEIVILVLATWRLSSLLVYEDGPLEIFLKLRERCGIVWRLGKDGVMEEFADLERENFLTEILLCVKCTSIWAAIFLTISYANFPSVTIILAIPFALSAGALLIDKHMNGG